MFRNTEKCMSPDLINTIGTIAGMIVAALGAFLFAFWIAMGIWTFHDIRQRTRDWLVIILAVALVLLFPIIGLILYMMIRPKATLADVYDRALEEEALLRELEQTAACHNCGVPVKEAWVYCPNCHNQLQHSCPSCGNLVRNEWEICVFCGSAQQRTAPQITAAPARPTALPGQTIAGQAVAGPTTAGQALPTQTMTTQALPGQALPGQPLSGQPLPNQPATTSRSFRSPFRRDAATPPQSNPGNNPVPPPPSSPDIDDAPYRPARMPE
jgi:RNA polymerase subunit RPABC4/transcription elongation factor Spt4